MEKPVHALGHSRHLLLYLLFHLLFLPVFGGGQVCAALQPSFSFHPCSFSNKPQPSAVLLPLQTTVLPDVKQQDLLPNSSSSVRAQQRVRVFSPRLFPFNHAKFHLVFSLPGFLAISFHWCYTKSLTLISCALASVEPSTHPWVTPPPALLSQDEPTPLSILCSLSHPLLITKGSLFPLQQHRFFRSLLWRILSKGFRKPKPTISTGSPRPHAQWLLQRTLIDPRSRNFLHKSCIDPSSSYHVHPYVYSFYSLL